MKKGGFQPSRREPCTPDNIERKLTEVNDILTRSENYITLEEQENALNSIEYLISPNDWGSSFVLMNVELATNDVFRNMVIDKFEEQLRPNILIQKGRNNF